MRGGSSQLSRLVRTHGGLRPAGATIANNCAMHQRRLRRARGQMPALRYPGPHLAVVSAGSKDNQVDQPPLVPASTAVPTAAAKQQNEKYNDEKRGGIHVSLPRNTAYCAAWNSDFFDNV